MEMCHGECLFFCSCCSGMTVLRGILRRRCRWSELQLVEAGGVSLSVCVLWLNPLKVWISLCIRPVNGTNGWNVKIYKLTFLFCCVAGDVNVSNAFLPGLFSSKHKQVLLVAEFPGLLLNWRCCWVLRWQFRKWACSAARDDKQWLKSWDGIV